MRAGAKAREGSKVAVDERLLEILVCPVSRVPIRRLPKDKLAILNRHRERSGLVYADGTSVDETLTEALVTTDGRTVYAVREGIPVMLEEQGIAARQVPGW